MLTIVYMQVLTSSFDQATLMNLKCGKEKIAHKTKDQTGMTIRESFQATAYIQKNVSGFSFSKVFRLVT